MTREYPKISTSQLFCVLLLSRISAEIIYPNKFSETALETIAVTVISEMIRFLIALPLIIYSFKGGNIHRSVYDKNRFFGWTGAIFSAILPQPAFPPTPQPTRPPSQTHPPKSSASKI